LQSRTLLAATAVAAATASLVAGSGGASTGPAQVRITDLQISRHMVRPAGGGITGTVEVVRQRLYKPGVTSRPIGRSDLVCTYLDNRERSCMGTYFLPKGSLVVAGALETRLLYEIAIVGGTGLFDNARGTLTVTSTHLSPRREVLLFRLTG
jgi:Dirigent-like protein